MNKTETPKRDIQISKALSYLLRHGAVKEKLNIDSNGYIPVSEILNHQRLKSHKCTFDDMLRIVENNDKKRFHLERIDESSSSEEKPEFYKICATQGHSIKTIAPTEELLKVVVTLDTPMIHGTNIQSCLLIVKSGFIKKMNRNQIHLSNGVIGKDEYVVSGMRYTANVLIYIKNDPDILKKLNIRQSMNGVLLSKEDIPLDLFEKIVILDSKVKGNNIQIKDELIDLLKTKNIKYEIE